MYFGDLYQNTATKPSTSLNRFPQGRNAFYQWIHDSLANGKPYNQMATELITAPAHEHLHRRRRQLVLNGYITGGPAQDIMDQMTANVFDTFLGITHVNCLLCHNGRGHLDQLSLWGTQHHPLPGMATGVVPVAHRHYAQRRSTRANNNIYYWSVQDNAKATPTTTR